MGQFLTLKNMVTKFFQNSNFSDFLGIKSEISHFKEKFENEENKQICPSFSRRCDKRFSGYESRMSW